MKKRKPQEPVRPFTYIEKEVSFTNSFDGTILKGTLTIPDNTNKYPAVILVTGSGPQNRDEELLGHKPFLVISDHLTKAGIAVLRYDDRHYKMSAKKGGQYTTMDLAGDAKAAFDFLFNHINIDNSFIGIAGHSEGGVIAPIVASTEPKVAFIISLAGPGLSGKIIGDKQAVDFAKDQKGIEFGQSVMQIIDDEPDFSLRKRKIWKAFNTTYGIFHFWGRFMYYFMIDHTASEWHRFFRKYNPADAWQKVKCPVLALNGEFDIQVYPNENLKAIEEALKIADNSNYTTLVIPKANHLFQTVESGGPKAMAKLFKEYQQTEQTFSPVVLDIMAEWINKQFKR